MNLSNILNRIYYEIRVIAKFDQQVKSILSIYTVSYMRAVNTFRLCYHRSKENKCFEKRYCLLVAGLRSSDL